VIGLTLIEKRDAATRSKPLSSDGYRDVASL